MRSSPVPPEETGGTNTGTPRRFGQVGGLPSARARRKRIALLVASTMSVFVLLASGTAWAFTGWVSGQLNRTDPFSGLAEGDRPDDGPTGAMNVLVIGSDGRGELDSDRRGELNVGHAKGRRSDTMMLVHLNHDRDRITVVGIPRDSWVTVPGHGPDKINAAYSYGGPELAIRTVESTTGVRIDHYVEINFGGFVEVVNALDGIEVCLPEPIYDDKAGLRMDAGTHNVNGVEALAFARTRKSEDGDLDRIDRQQQVMAALLNKALSSETLTDPNKFTTFLDTALGSVTVDEGLSASNIRRLANQLRTIGLDNVTFTQVPVAKMNYQTDRGDVAVLWNEEKADKLFGRIQRDEPIAKPQQSTPEEEKGGAEDPLAPEDITLEVYNGVGTPGLGAQVRGDLEAAGYRVPEKAENWKHMRVAKTAIRYGPSRAEAAQVVAESIPGSHKQEDDSLGGTIQVVLGYNFQEVAQPGPADQAAAEEPEPQDSPEEKSRDAINATTAKENVCG